jgi:hypothetical protein
MVMSPLNVNVSATVHVVPPSTVFDGVWLPPQPTNPAKTRRSEIDIAAILFRVLSVLNLIGYVPPSIIKNARVRRDGQLLITN